MFDISIVNFFLHRPPSDMPFFAHVPMGPLYLVSSLESAGFSVDFHDYQVGNYGNPYDPDNINKFLEDTSSKLIGISCMSNMLPFLVLGLRKFKRTRPDAHIVLGGPGVSGSATEIIKSFPEINAVVRGEGEEIIVDILNASHRMRSWTSIPGLVFRNRKEVQVNAARPRRKNIDTIPIPAYHKLNLQLYKQFPILTSRGCIYKCTFCDIPRTWDRHIEWRSIESVLEEVQFLQSRYNADSFSILDDCFVLNRRQVVEYCQQVIKRNMSFEWGCMCRADLLDDELMALMHYAGCRRIFLGIESGSKRVRSIAGKGLKINSVEELLVKAAQYFEVAASFILGFPFETIDEFRDTIYLIIYCLEKGLKPQLAVLSPLPQSELNTSGLYEKEFDPALISGMVFPNNEKKNAWLMQRVLTTEVRGLIQSHPKIFSGFYHYKAGKVRNKLELAMKYGLRV